MSLSIIVMFRIHPFVNDANWEGKRPGLTVQIDHHQPATSNNMGVSKNGDPGYPPKWMVYHGKTLLKCMIWGFKRPPILGNIHINRKMLLDLHFLGGWGNMVESRHRFHKSCINTWMVRLLGLGEKCRHLCPKGRDKGSLKEDMKQTR